MPSFQYLINLTEDRTRILKEGLKIKLFPEESILGIIYGYRMQLEFANTATIDRILKDRWDY